MVVTIVSATNTGGATPVPDVDARVAEGESFEHLVAMRDESPTTP
jgi:hypothetical protein